jgi:GNAT superfamily N-acetyltransferase
MTGVARSTPERLGVLAPVFGRAFVDEPMMLWPMGLRGDVVDRLTRCFAYFLEEALEHDLVWEVDGGKGAAVWMAASQPEAWETDHPWHQPRIIELTDDGGHRYQAFWEWVESRTPAEPLWLLDSIAVDPDAQGRGLGSALISDGLIRAYESGVGAFLSTGTRRNVAIYERCGFRVVEHVDAPGGGPHTWFMRADP